MPAEPPRAAAPEVKLVNRRLPDGDVKLFAPEGSAEGCASGECLPGEAPAAPTSAPSPSLPPEPPAELYDNDEPEPEPAAPVRPAAAARAAPTGGDDERWRRAVEAVRQALPRHGKSLSFARFLGFTPEGVRLAFPPDAAFHRAQITGMSRSPVEAELALALGRPIKIVEETNAQVLQAAPKSIAEVEAGDRAAREKQIEDKVRAHPALRNVVRHLGGTLEHITYLEPAQRPPILGGADEGDAGPPVD